jgi:hypothetical protein
MWDNRGFADPFISILVANPGQDSSLAVDGRHCQVMRAASGKINNDRLD